MRLLGWGVLGGLAYAIGGSFWHDDRTAWLWATLAAAALGWAAARVFAELAALRALQDGVRRASEGRFDPIPIEPHAATFVGRLIPEYNTTISTFGLTFQSVVECQGRFLDERNRINTILQSLPVGVLSIGDDLRVNTANRQADAVFGVESGKLIGANLFDLLELTERDRSLLRDAFLYKYPVRNQEIGLKLGGKTRYIALSLAFYSDAENDMGSVLTLQDITEHRALMETVTMREKLVAMGQLAAGVAHELNTPLGNVLGYAQLLERGAEDRPKLAGYARIIAEETRRCSRVVQELLGYARKDECSDETCDVNQLVRELVETFVDCRLKRYRIDARMELAPGALLVEGGCGQLDIVLTNLIVNAIHALDKVPDPRIVVRTWQEGPQVFISVSDNGPGVAPDVRGRLFDPFFTTKAVGQGTGLGLPISNAIVSRRGGFINYDADYTDGARFVVTLPAVDLGRMRQ
ncbi:MAG: PAS domain-containing protein [Burkholderiaceae bacterium]|nr:PAS domain-containing protein [Burkholderiaceae bacterium]